MLRVNTHFEVQVSWLLGVVGVEGDTHDTGWGSWSWARLLRWGCHHFRRLNRRRTAWFEIFEGHVIWGEVAENLARLIMCGLTCLALVTRYLSMPIVKLDLTVKYMVEKIVEIFWWSILNSLKSLHETNTHKCRFISFVHTHLVPPNWNDKACCNLQHHQLVTAAKVWSFWSLFFCGSVFYFMLLFLELSQPSSSQNTFVLSRF